MLKRIQNHINRTLKKLIVDLNIIGRNVRIGESTYVRGSELKGNVRIGKGCKIFKCVFNGNIEIGNHSSFWGPNITIEGKINDISIGNFCSIARNVIIQEYNHDSSRFSTYFFNKNILKNSELDVISKGPVIIGHDVWIGSNSIILSGVNIGTGAIIGANSVVTNNIPPYAIAVGSPAKVVKYRFSDEVIQKLLTIAWWEWDVKDIKDKIDDLEMITR